MSQTAKAVKIRANKNFWQTLPKPFFVLAPMANVTDTVFRKLFAKYGRPDVTWTEFVSADGLISEGKDRLIVDLEYSTKERPIVAQLFTGHPEAMKKAAELVQKLKFDGLDINMGCPDKSVEKQGGGASLIKNPKIALAVLDAAREGAPKIPVSVKTRLGYNKVDFEWLRTLLSQNLPVLTVHLRTRKEMSEVPAHWELMPEIIKIRNEIAPGTLIIGNGDVKSMSEAVEKCKKYGCDGVMIGRGIFGTPWFFGKLGEDGFHRDVALRTDAMLFDMTPKTPEERLKIMLEHTKLYEKVFKGHKNFDVMKKHFKAYVSGWDNAKDLRVRLMECKNYKEVESVVKSYISSQK